MREDGVRVRRWLRPLGLFFVAWGLAIGNPAIVVCVSFALLTVLAPGRRLAPLAFSAVAFALVFAGTPTDGLWYVERGWAILVGGAFAGLTLMWPERSFFPRALWSLALGSAVAALVLAVVNGWSGMERLVTGRIDESIEVFLEIVSGLTVPVGGPDIAQTMRQTGEVQGVVFPALVALSTLASLGVAWWLHLRLTAGSDRGLAGVREFRFPDYLIWVLIGGIALVLLSGWSAGLGRAGTNLMAFMGALYILRGVGVLLFFVGGVSFLGGILVALGLILAAPVLLAGALVVGMGDSWFDLRSRVSLTGQGNGKTGS